MGQIEPDVDTWDLTALEEPLERLSTDGLQPFISLGTYEDLGIGESLLPADLQARLAAGEIAWDDRDVVDRFNALLDGKPLILQELGCHAGYEGRASPTGSTPTLQKHFFEVVFEELAARPLFRAAVVFQLVDWDPDLVESFYSAPLREAGIPESFIAQFAESLETVGLIRFADGASRPAWNTFVGAVKPR